LIVNTVSPAITGSGQKLAYLISLPVKMGIRELRAVHPEVPPLPKAW
jgi:hypothetical protein